MADGKSSELALTSNHCRYEEFLFTYEHVPRICVVMADGSTQVLRVGNRSAEDLRKVLEIGGYKEDGEDNYGPVRRPHWPNIAALAVWLLSVGTLLTHAVRSRKVRPIPPKSS